MKVRAILMPHEGEMEKRLAPTLHEMCRKFDFAKDLLSGEPILTMPKAKPRTRRIVNVLLLLALAALIVGCVVFSAQRCETVPAHKVVEFDH